jgi:hypothetical protein
VYEPTYATIRKVAVSKPDEVNMFFNLPNNSGRNLDLWSSQPLKELSTRSLLGVKGRMTRKADNLTAILSQFSRKHESSTSHKLMGLHGPLQGELYLYLQPNNFALSCAPH